MNCTSVLVKQQDNYGAELAFEMAKTNTFTLKYIGKVTLQPLMLSEKVYPNKIASIVFLSGGHVAHTFENNIKGLKIKKV